MNRSSFPSAQLRPRRTTLTAGLALAALLLAALPGIALGAAAITFEFDQGLPNCVAGEAPMGNSLKLVWRDSFGALKASQANVEVYAGGSWMYCDPTAVVKTGDRFKAVSGTTTRTFTMPLVTLVVDRVANDFHGRAPAHSTATLYYRLSPVDDFLIPAEVTADATGRWSFADGANASWDVDDSDATIHWNSSKGDSVSLYGYPASVRVTIGRAKVRGTVADGVSARVVLRDGVTDARKGSTTTGDNANFTRRFRDSTGHRVPVSVGDHVVGTGIAADLDWYVPGIDMTASTADDTVSGRCENAENRINAGVRRRVSHRSSARLRVQPP